MAPWLASPARRLLLLVAVACVARAAGFVSAALAAEPQPPRFTREQMEAALADAPPFRFVYGTRDPAAAPVLRSRALLLAQRAFGVDSSRVVADRDLDQAGFASGPMFLLGTPDENEWTRRLAAALPVQFERHAFRWQGRLYDQPLDALQLAWPNPLAPKRFLILFAGNSLEATARRGGIAFGDEDWRIVRDGELVRSGTFAQDPARPWHYDAARDHDREADRDRYLAGLRSIADRALVVRAPAGLAAAPGVFAGASALLTNLSRSGLAAPAGAPPLTLTLYRSLEQKGQLTRDTHPEHWVAGGSAPVAHAALPFGRETLDLWSVAALRLVQLGGSAQSRFLVPAAAELAGRWQGEPLERSLSRLYFGGVLPTAAEAATRTADWRSPLVWTPARALLVRALWECTPAAARRATLLALVRRDPPGQLDSLCRLAGSPSAGVERRYRLLADSLARAGRSGLALARREPWRPQQGFQRGVCLAHRVGLEHGYLSAECAQQLRVLRDAGAGWVSLTPFAWLGDPAVPELSNSSDSGPDGESEEAVCEAAARAHALGLRVWLKPHVWTRGWAGDLQFTPAGWQRFFDAYGELALHWALLAEREGIDGLFVGHELASSTALAPDRWRALIGDVRRVYTGTLSYSANWDEVARVPFWDALDLIGVSFYAPLADKPTRDPATLRAGATHALNGLHALSRRFGRPVVISELGYTPSPDAPLRPWEATRGATDPELQRACYEAALAAIEPCDWLAGAYFWKWGSSARAGDDAFDPRGQPAESVLTQALRSWQGRPVRVPKREGSAATPGPP
jgi:hypothetical protein